MAIKKADADARKFKASMKELTLQLKQSEHRVRAKEMVLDRLKDRLKEQADNERKVS